MAIDFAVAHPEAVDKLVLFAPQVNILKSQLQILQRCSDSASLLHVHKRYDYILAKIVVTRVVLNSYCQ